MIPFSRDQFVAVFVSYNESIWPVEIIAYLLAILAVVLLFRPGPATNRLVSAVLGLFWVWTGVAYHWLLFSGINKAAYLFAALFVVQGACLAAVGALRDRLGFGFRSGLRQWIGVMYLLYATVAYPVIGMVMGHGYVELPMFGVTPCPVTIFTLGVFLLATKPVRRPFWPFRSSGR